MARDKNTTPPSTTTTTVPSTENTIPGDVGSGNAPIVPGGTTYSGGINPSYKPPAKTAFGDPSKPYFYTTDDWQMLLSFNKDSVIAIQQKLAQAFPGFKPRVMGDKYDTNTIKYFKYALNRINQFSVDEANPYGIRGKNTMDALTILTKSPTTTGSSSLGGSVTTYRESNPADLKAVFQKVAQTTLGRELGEGDLNRMVDAFQSKEVQYQKQYQRGGVVTGPPAAETFAESRIQNDFGTEVDTRKLDSIFSAVDAALSGRRQ